MMSIIGQQLAQRWIQNFRKWDTSGENVLDAKEVFTAIANPQVQGEDAAALATLYREIQHDYQASGAKTFPTVDRDTLKGYLLRLQDRHLDIAFASFNAKIQGAQVEPFNQGIAPSCALVSAVYGLDNRDAVLQSMVRHDEQGFHVKFPGLSREIHFAQLSDTEKALHTSGMEVLEKAWGMAEGGSEIGAIAVARGNGQDRPITALTGNAAQNLLLPNPRQYEFLNAVIQKKKPGAPELKPKPIEGIMATVRRALDDKAVVTTGTWSQSCLKPGLQHAHAYTVLDCNLERQTVTLRNPYGQGEPEGDGKNDGQFTLSFADYVVDFNSVTVETAQPATLA